MALYGSLQIVNRRQHFDVSTPIISSKRACFLPQTRCDTHNFLKRKNHKNCPPIFVVLSAVEDAGVSSSQFEDFVVSTTRTNEATELKIGVEVSSAKTRAIFDDVFNKMVAAAQPIPGFRRIPRDILLEVLGPTNVYKEVIKKVIDTTVAEFVEKEDLKVSKDLRVEQSFEDLEELFEPDEKFSFDAVIKLQETD
ncbi:hypothetical protein WN943_016078 [Citrus x changshan-huyou]